MDTPGSRLDRIRNQNLFEYFEPISYFLLNRLLLLFVINYDVFKNLVYETKWHVV